MNQNDERLNYPCTQTYLKSNIVCNAKRTEKSACFLRGTPVDTLCWNAPDSAFLSKTESQRVASVSSSFRSLLSQLSKYDVNVIFPEIRLESSAKNRKTQITQKREFVSDLMIVFVENRKNIDPIVLYWGWKHKNVKKVNPKINPCLKFWRGNFTFILSADSIV